MGGTSSENMGGTSSENAAYADTDETATDFNSRWLRRCCAGGGHTRCLPGPPSERRKKSGFREEGRRTGSGGRRLDQSGLKALLKDLKTQPDINANDEGNGLWVTIKHPDGFTSVVRIIDAGTPEGARLEIDGYKPHCDGEPNR